MCLLVVFFFKQKTAYEMRISDWSSDVCSSDLSESRQAGPGGRAVKPESVLQDGAARPGDGGAELRLSVVAAQGDRLADAPVLGGDRGIADRKALGVDRHAGIVDEIGRAHV